MSAERLQKVLAASGLCARRKAEAWIVAGRITVNGMVAELGQKVDTQRDAICVDGRPIELDPCSYWLLHKPKGVLSTTSDPRGRKTVLDFLPHGLPRMVPVGRLDLDTEGLVLLTNDGEMVNALLHPSMGNEREYLVEVKGHVAPESLKALAEGIELEDGQTAPARVSRVRTDRTSHRTVFSLTMIEGRKRQIRRMLRVMGHPVLRLLRVRMGPLRLGTLPSGKARSLRKEEVAQLRRHVAKLVSARR